MKRLGLALTLLALLIVPAGAQAKPHDGDRDRLPDRWEAKHQISTKAKSAAKDPDGDGLTNLSEYRAKTKPKRKDSDGDGVWDDDEDGDRDRVDNGNEEREGTKPRDRDSDDDGVRDGNEDRDRDGLRNAGEDATGNDPKDPDSDDDGVKDGAEQAGVVVAFDGAQLTIDPVNGPPITALVGDWTDISCKSEDEAEDGPHGGKPGKPGVKAATEDDEPSDDEEWEDEPSDDEEDWDEGPADEEEWDDGEGEDDEYEDGNYEDDECSTDDLVPGARVHEAVVRLTSDGLLFKKVELIS